MSPATFAKAASAGSPRNRSLRTALGLLCYLACAALLCIALMMRLTQPQPGEPRDLAGPLWTILVGMVCNSSCAALGCYLVLRRMSLLGDAISHAVLPGIAVAYLLTGSISGWPIFLGALVLGILTSALTQAITSLARISEDTSLGVVFTSLFALGVILLTRWARHADLDAECVFYGLIDLVATDIVPFAGIEVSRPLLTLVPVLLATLAFIGVFWKELNIVAFDPALAKAMGIQVVVIHYTFMAMVACVAVASFESVGAILVVAMLIVPPATAALLTDRLGWMIVWSIAIASTSAAFGYLLAVALNTSVAGAMAVAAGVQFATAVFLAPQAGLVSRWLRNKSLAIRIAAEDILAGLYRAEETSAACSRSAANQPSLIGRLAQWRLVRQGLVASGAESGLALTSAGRSSARGLIRAHRLWETYLDTHFDLPRDHLHDAAERMEHFLDAQLQEELAAELAHRAVDPHGKIIPPSS